MKKQIKNFTKNLAWQGTTVKEKRDLLNESILISEKLKLEGKIKDSFLSLASTCIDIVNTAQAIRKTLGWNKEWGKLEKDSLKIISNTVLSFKVKNLSK